MKKFMAMLKSRALVEGASLCTAFALFFAAAPCTGRLHEAEVPEELR